MTERPENIFEINNIGEAEKRQHLLYQIASQSGTDLDEQLNNALKLTTQLLDMEVGIISMVKGNTYTIEYHFSTDDGLENGQKFKVDETYCSITLENEETVAIDHMEISPWKRHPCYEFFQLESYIGTAVVVDDHIYGTVNFSSTHPKKKGFIPSDVNLVNLLATWIGGILKRKQIKQELKEQKELYQLISTNSAEMVCLHQLDGTYQFVSPSARDLLGYAPKDLIGKDPYDFFHPEDRERIKSKSHDKALNNNPTKHFEYRIRKKNGDYIWFDTATETVTNDDGEVIHLQTTSREITEKKKLEILFSESQQMAKVGGWEYELSSGNLMWTDEVYRIHEISIGTPVKVEDGLSFYPGEAKKIVQERIDRAIQTGEPWDEELPFITAKGKEIWVRAKGHAEFDDGKAYKLIGTFQDITSQKENEEKIKAQNEQLQALTKTRDKFYSIIAHDLKSAFYGITGMLTLIKEDLYEYADMDEMILRQISMVESSSNNAHQLLENLLDWTRIQSENLVLDPSEFDLNKEVEHVIQLLKASAEYKKVTLKRSLVPDLEIKADRSMISTILRNIISNAIKFSPEQSSVKINTQKDGEYVKIVVKDNGIGMPESVRESLFSPSSRPKRKGTQNEQGTGLGLLLSKDMIDLHNGKIEVMSKEGKGSEFRVWIPIVSS